MALEGTMDSKTSAMTPNAPEPSMQLLAEAAQDQTRSLTNGIAEASDHDDGSSSLSELDDPPAMEGPDNRFSHEPESEEDEEEDDTEAETERLEESPQKLRQHKQVLLSGDSSAVASVVLEGEPTTAKPSLENDKLAPTEHGIAREEGGGEENDGAPQTSDISSLDDSVEASEPETNDSSSSKKRKRNDDEDTQQSLKKVALELANHVADQAEGIAQSQTPQDTATGEDEPPVAEPDASEEEGEESGPDEPSTEAATATANDGLQDAADSNDEDADMEDAEAEADADAASAARSEEEMMKKKSAMDLLTRIEANFAILRDKLFAEKNQQLTDELATMQSESVTHPEYLAMVEAIEQLRNDRLKHAQTLYNYKVQALRNRSIANRAQILSQFVQRARDLRETSLETIGKDWYHIQRGRRKIDEDDDASLNHFAGSRIEQVAHHVAYNTEVSILSGVAKYVGFPAAPQVGGATQAEMEDDLRQMEISLQPVPATTSNTAATLHFGRQRPATEEQWSGPQPPWANPQHPIHSINNAQHQTSNPLRSTSPFTTPAQKRASDANMGSASTIPALPSSSLAPTPMSADNGQQKTSKSIPTATFDASAETPSRAPTGSDRSTLAQGKKPNGKTPLPDSSALEPEASKASPAPSHPLPAAVDELRQHTRKASPTSSRGRKGSPAIQQEHIDSRFTPQTQLQASVEVANS